MKRFLLGVVLVFGPLGSLSAQPSSSPSLTVTADLIDWHVAGELVQFDGNPVLMIDGIEITATDGTYNITTRVI
jgi:hypothetical protein